METPKCLNCQKEVAQKKGKRAKLYCSDLCRATFHQKKKIPVNDNLCIELPKDYINVKKIMVLKEDGTLTDIETFPKNDNFDLWMTAFNALNEVVDDSGKKMFFTHDPKAGIITPPTSHPAGKSVTVTIKGTGNPTEPKENTMAFFNKYGCNTWGELKQLKK